MVRLTIAADWPRQCSEPVEVLESPVVICKNLVVKKAV